MPDILGGNEPFAQSLEELSGIARGLNMDYADRVIVGQASDNRAFLTFVDDAGNTRKINFSSTQVPLLGVHELILGLAKLSFAGTTLTKDGTYLTLYELP